MRELTIGELIELAKIGRKHALEDLENGVCHWIGQLPTDEELSNAACNIYHAVNGVGQIEGQVIYNTLE